MNVEQIVRKAQEASGLTDLGDPAALEGLTALVSAANEEARLSEVGAQRFETNLVGTLTNRLRIVDYLKQHPELLERPIEQPMFVFGLPRTGTTLTINLLSADPSRRAFLRWEALHSVPPARAGALHNDPRCHVEQERLNQAVKFAPEIAAAHYEDADSPTECQFSMALSFCSQVFDSTARVPSYRKWFFEADYLPAFRFHKQMLQLLQAENGGIWTLKNPWHPLYLDALKTVYPDAQLVMTHRDPVEVVGSACSLIRLVRPMFSNEVDLREIADQLIETFDLMIARQNAYRAQHGADSIYDLQFDDLMQDPMGEMRKLYEHFDTPFTDDVAGAMQSLLAQNERGKHGKHDYSLEEFGLTADYVRDHFKSYREQFRIPSRAERS